MKEFCPNKASKEFKELASIFGEDKAYFLWMRNKGNELDKAPNGAESKLFNDLLQYFNGDRKKALIAKAKTFSNEFFDWFGDWTGTMGELYADGVERTNTEDGKIKLSLPSHTKENPRQLVLEPQGDNKYYVHIRIWDGDHIPGKITDEDKQLLFNALYNELPAGGEILFPKSGEGYYGTRGTVAALKRLSRDPRFSPGEKGVLQYKDDPESEEVKKYEGTGFVKKDFSNVSKVVDENGEPLVVWHGSPNDNIQEFNRDLIGSTTDPGVFGKGFYFTPLKSYARQYGENMYLAYLNIKNPIYKPSDSDVIGRTYEEIAVDLDKSYRAMYDRQIKRGKSEQDAKNSAERHRHSMQQRNENLKKLLQENHDGGIFLERTTDQIKPLEEQIVVPNSNQIKHVENFGEFSHNGNIYHNISPVVSPFGESKLGELHAREVAIEREFARLREEWEPLREQMKQAQYDTLSRKLIRLGDENIRVTEKPDHVLWIDTNRPIFTQVSIKFEVNGNSVESSLLFPHSGRILREDYNYMRVDNPIRDNAHRLVYELLRVLKDNGHNVVYSDWTPQWSDRSIQKTIQNMSKLFGIDFSKIATGEQKYVNVIGPSGEQLKQVRFRIVMNIDAVMNKLRVLGNSKELYDVFDSIYNQQQPKENKELLIKALKAKEADLVKRQQELTEQLENVKKEIRQEEWELSDLPFNITQGSLIWAVQRQINRGATHNDILNLIDSINYTYGSSLKYNKKTRKVYGKEFIDKSDDIARTRDKNVKRIEAVVNYLNNKFGGKIEVFYIEEADWLKSDKLPDVSNSCIIGDTVYLRKSRMTTEIAAEEMLHVLVHAMKNGKGDLGNRELFDNLFKKAKQQFPKLWDEIQSVYKYNHDEELVTQALARYVNKDFDNRDSYTIQDLINRFKNYLVKLFKDILEYFGDKRYTTLGNINPIIDFQDISDMILAKDLYFDIQTIKEIHSDSLNNKFHNLNSNNTAQSAYELADQIDSERESYINNIVEQYKNDHNDATDEKIASIKNQARIQFNKNKLAQIKAKPNKNDAESIIIAALSTDDLQNAEGIQSILDRINGEGESSIYLTDKDKDVFRQIKEGTKVRLKSQMSRVVKKTKLIDDLKQILAIIDGKNEDSVDDVFDVIKDFLIRAEYEIEKTTKFVTEDLGEDLSTWDPKQINYIKQDLIGYYEGLLKSLKDLFSGNSAVREMNQLRMEDPNQPDLQHLVDKLYHDLHDLQQYYQSRVVMPYAEKILTDFVNDSDIIDNKEQFIKNMKTWLYQDTAYGDINASEVVIGMASRSKSPIVRIIEKMMSDTEFERNRQVLKKGRELIALYNKIRPVGAQISFSNFQKMFMELDGEGGTDGKPTGYWVRDRNYGKFYKDKDEFEAKLREKYKDKGLTWKINDYSGAIELIFPDEKPTADKSVYNQYYDELDEWLDKHCERRYKLEYYKKKRRILSPEALQAQQLIQHQIDILCQKAIDEDGFVDSNLLTPHERQKLQSLKKQKKELACPYIFRTNSKGIVTLEAKVGPDAEIAEQISKWNEWIAGKVNYIPNDEKFQKALNKYPKGSVERRIFQRDNYIRKINPDIYEAIKVWYDLPDYGEEYNKLKSKYRSIISHIKEREGFSAHNLDLIGTGIDEDTSVWRELQRLEQEMADIRAQQHMDKVKDEDEEEKPEFLTSYMIMSQKEDKTFYNYLRNLWMSRPGFTIKEMDDAFNTLFSYTDRKGRIRALKAFSYMGPVGETFKFDPSDKEEAEKPSYIHEYSSQFYELDESSDLVNDKWDKKLHSSLQPKVGGTIDYTNQRYKEIMKNDGYRQFYELLISTMNEANEMIPQRAVERNYLMPQITARGMQSLGRVRSFLDLQTSLGYMFQDVFTPKFAEKDGDVSTNWDLPRRPDGTVVNNIPIRFVKRLDQPELITSDVVGAVIMYYNMAVNYKLKSENLPSLELMREAINPEISTGSHKLKRQYDKVNNMLDFRYYGKEDVIGDASQAPSELNKAMTNVGKKFRKLASLSMLAINFTTIEVGYIDAFLSAVADSVGGKYFTKQDLMYGYGQALKHLPNIIANIGNPDTKDWMICAMQYNNLSKSNSEIFERSDQSRFRKALNQVRMGGYTMADYLINTMILGATYNHYRLVDTPDGKSKKFMSKSDAIREFTKVGYTEQEAIAKWDSAKTTLQQAYIVKDGVLTAKEEYKQYINNKLENQIAGRLRDRTAIYNGVIPTVEKAKIQQNVWGSYLTLMRNFYVNTFWERASSGYDTASEEEIASSKFGMRSADSAGFVNFETGEVGNGLWWSFLKGIYKYVSNTKHLIDGKDMRQLTYDQKYAVKRILTEMVMISIAAWLMLTSIAFARSNDYDDDKDPTWTVNIFDPEGQDRGLLEFNGRNYDKKITNWLRWKVALLATRTFTERSTFYWPGTVTELISSPSTAKSYLDDLGYNLELFMDLFEINGHDRSEVIKSGGYRGMTRGTRDILKITGFTGIDNVVRGWHTSGIKSTLNWYGQVTPNNFLIPSKKVWMEEQGLTSSKPESKKKKISY